MDFTLKDLATGLALDRVSLLDRGEITIGAFLRPCRLKILMVVDGYPGSFLNVSFSHSYFGLSAVLDTLRNNPEYFVKFDVTRAHRQTDTFKPNPATDPDLHAKYGPHFENFRFTQTGFDINEYDQVWLFGARSNENDIDRLTDPELEVLARWMDERKGGLFATGDHADLGAALCARVPRARTMRRWTPAQGVPQPSGVNRHDTNLKGHDTVYTFDDESDDLPMRVIPKLYHLASLSPFQRRRAPHPVLCGSDGLIDILPDHPHEGWVYEEADVDLTQPIAFGTYSAPEYPTVAAVQPRPEVVAHAQVQSDHQASDFKGTVNPKSFGAIGAYDGHRANVGRVVVDSTWHHWFDVNLTGRPIGSLDSAPMNASNPKTLGFLATPAGQAALGRIQNYFRNVAMWLASPTRQRCMFFRATWGAVIRYPVVERLHPRLPIWELAEAARDAIGRRAGQCTLTWWIIDLFPPKLRERLWAIRELPPIPPEPCLTCPPFPVIETYLLGGITRELIRLAYALQDATKVDETAIAVALMKGGRAGLGELAQTYRASLAKSKDHLQQLEALQKAVPSERVLLDTHEPGGGAPRPVKPPVTRAAKPAARRKGRR